MGIRRCCQTCESFRPNKTNPAQGECVHDPPTVARLPGGKVVTMRPEVDADDRCTTGYSRMGALRRLVNR